jgi:ketosteroid isomerase-like protein
MTRLIAFGFVIVASLFAVDPAGGVREASANWRQAVIKQDQAALQRLLADDLTYSHSNGKTNQNKAEYIAAVTKGPSHYESFEDTDTQIRVYGKTAVLTGYVDVKTPGKASYRVRTLEVYVQNNGQWQMTAHQSARVSP